MGNFEISDEKSNFETSQASNSGGSLFTAYVSTMFDPSLTWSDIDWLKRQIFKIRVFALPLIYLLLPNP